MDRVFLPPEVFSSGRAVVAGAERHHLADVLRVQVGDRFLATNGSGCEYLLEAEVITRREVTARVVEECRRDPGPGRNITLAIAPPKGGRMEIAVEKTVEFGIGRIVPLKTSRSVVKGRDESSRADRWRRVARSATAQSGGFYAPEIAPVCSLAEALEGARSGRILFAHPALTAQSVPSAMAEAGTDPVTFFVGPEGGFTDEELEEGRRFDATLVSLGPTRLRSETAAIVAVTLALASRA
jgi:16S rRNA (uracil1498-N3)-methyltransferase